MTEAELSAVIRGIGPVIIKAIREAVAPIEKRLAEVEARPIAKDAGVSAQAIRERRNGA